MAQFKSLIVNGLSSLIGDVRVFGKIHATNGVTGTLKAVQKYNVTYSETKTVVSYIGGDITALGANDVLEVYYNTTHLTEGVHYTINRTTKVITAVDSAGWVYDTTVEPQANLFEFVAYIFAT